MNKLGFFLVAVIIGLAFLLVRENEMRVSAETKLSNLQFKATATINEKGDTISDLSTQLGEMQASLQRTTDEAVAAIGERDQTIASLHEEAQIAAAEHKAELEERDKFIAGLDADIKDKAEKYDAALKKKNTEITELSEQLRKNTERLAAALKEKEKIESETYDAKQRAEAAERKVEKLREDNRRLEALVKVCVETPAAPDTADIPPVSVT
jgi:chromosome segregation ATPase